MINVVFIPSISAGATDARQYENICPVCLRCAPFLSEAAETAGLVHGTNERISQRSYIQGPAGADTPSRRAPAALRPPEYEIM